MSLIGGLVGFGMSPLEPRGDVIKDLFLYFLKCFLCIYSFFFFFFFNFYYLFIYLCIYLCIYSFIYLFIYLFPIYLIYK